MNRATNDLNALPLVVMLAMTPSMLEGKANVLPILPEPVMVKAPETPSPYGMTVSEPEAPEPEAPQANNGEKAPYGWGFLKNKKILLDMPVKGNDLDYNLLFTKQYKDTDHNVSDVYLIKKGREVHMDNSHTTPPEITHITYHDIGKDEFCSVTLSEYILDEKGENIIGHCVREVILNNEAAQMILDLTGGVSPYGKNISGIGFSASESAQCRKPIVHMYKQ